MLESKWFWVLAGAVAVRCWEAHAAKKAGCLQKVGDAFAFKHATNTVFELSGARCGAAAPTCPEPAPCPTTPQGCGTC